MYTDKLGNMTRGWVVGDFDPSLYKTNNVEVAVKLYKAGDYEHSHYHKVATEITIITQGTVEMNGIRYHVGDIIVIEPGDVTDFCAVTDAANTVIKIPGATNDKFMAEE